MNLLMCLLFAPLRAAAQADGPQRVHNSAQEEGCRQAVAEAADSQVLPSFAEGK